MGYNPPPPSPRRPRAKPTGDCKGCGAPGHRALDDGCCAYCLTPFPTNPFQQPTPERSKKLVAVYYGKPIYEGDEFQIQINPGEYILHRSMPIPSDPQPIEQTSDR